MAGSSPASSYPSYPSLSADQQKLLLAALSSNANSRSLNMADFLARADPQLQQSNFSKSTDAGLSQTEGIDPSVFNTVPRSAGHRPVFGEGLMPESQSGHDFDVDVELPQNDYDADDSFGNFDPNYDGEFGEKRKSPEDDEDDEEGDSKRREGDDKAPKKPGRKPLTSEPTTKRKAQNRAAQRAFRERKEKHLKDLELKVSSLEQASESANHENDLLKAQIAKLQTELQEYRKRLSLAGSALNGSPTTSESAEYGSRNRSSTGSGTFDFQFDFPGFGDLFPNNNSANAGASNGFTNGNNNDYNSLVKQENESRSNSTVASPQHNGSYSSRSPPNNKSNGDGAFTNGTSGMTPGGIFSPGIFGMNDTSYGFPAFGSPNSMQNGASPSAQNAVRSNSTQGQSSTASATSNAASPSNSSMSHNGTAISSAGTSPEPTNGYTNGDNSHKQKQINGATILSPVQDANIQASTVDLTNFQFDPTLFGGYRETQDAIFGDGDFSGGLYDDYLNLSDFDANGFNMNNGNVNGSRNTPLTNSTPKPTLANQVAKHQDECVGEEVHTSDKMEEKNMMTAHKMWEQLSTCPKYKDGDLDIDGLCSELSKKATCSESGAVIPKAEWEAALWRLVGQDEPAGAKSKGATTAK